MIVGGEDVNLCLRPFLYPSPGRGLISQHRLYEAQRDGGGSYPQPALTLGWGYSQQRSCGADTTPIGGFRGFGFFGGFRDAPVERIRAQKPGGLLILLTGYFHVPGQASPSPSRPRRGRTIQHHSSTPPGLIITPIPIRAHKCTRLTKLSPSRDSPAHNPLRRLPRGLRGRGRFGAFAFF